MLTEATPGASLRDTLRGLRSYVSIALWALPVFAVPGLGCGGSELIAGTADAASEGDANTVDAGVGSDASAPLGWVDFAISGCATGDGSEASPCLGPSPLVVQFTALAPAEVQSQIWTFGDGSDPDPSLGPVHRFAEPGSYDIGLNVDGPGGSAGRIRLAAVVVLAAPLGARCETDSQCASDDCACGDGVSCPAPLDQGICLRDCDSDAACGDNLCIDLGATGSEPWQRTTCLPSCSPGASTCGPNATCQALLGVDGELGFACFATGLLAPIGASCRDADGQLDNARCASGQCLDLGLRGMCSADCETALCPEGTACATPTSGSPGPLCVATCDSVSCDGDAELSCRDPGVDFTIDGAAIDAGYCTPSFP